jgi:DNA-damage-inducible protein J
MQEVRLSIRIDENVKNQADQVFDDLGMNMSTGIAIYLKQVALQQRIPFALALNRKAAPLRQSSPTQEKPAEGLRAAKPRNPLDGGDDDEDELHANISANLPNGLPVAHYDFEQKRPYLEYPDGHKEYPLSQSGALAAAV